MKRIITILALACATSAFSQVTWLQKVHDFGAFDEDAKKKTATFSFVNSTDEPVSIVSATATCGCTTPSYSTDPVAPGDTATIEVSYDPTGRPGRFEKQIYVRTSDSYDRTKLLIKGTVIGNPVTINGRYPVSIGPLKLRTGAAMFGRAFAGHEKMHYVDGYNMSADTLAPVITSAPEWLKIEVSPEKIAPGEMMSFDLTFLGSKCHDWGIVSDSVMISPAPGAEAVAYPIVVIVEEDFSKLTPQQLKDAPIASLSADRIDLQAIPEGSSSPVQGKVALTNRGNDPLKIRRIYSEDLGLTVSPLPVDILDKGKSADIIVTFDPSVQPTGIVNARLTVITNDPASPTQTVRIVAERN